LLCNGEVVEYASRALTKSETLWAQCEKELGSILYALERFDTYVYGRHVQIQTDHKPLLAIHKKALSSAPRRLQRMMLRLQRYDYTLNYRPGSQMILADTLSRAYPAAQTEEMSFTKTLASLSSVDAEQMSELRLVASDETIKRSMTAASGDSEYTQLLRQIAAGCLSHLATCCQTCALITRSQKNLAAATA